MKCCFQNDESITFHDLPLLKALNMPLFIEIKIIRNNQLCFIDCLMCEVMLQSMKINFKF